MLFLSLVILGCISWEVATVASYPASYNYPYYGSNLDALTYSAGDSSRGGMVLSRYRNPYYNTQMGGGLAAFMIQEPEYTQQRQSQYYLPDRRRQTQETNFFPQQNEVIPQQFPQNENIPIPDKTVTTDASELAEPTERNELTTVKATPELIEPEIEEVEEEPELKSKKRVTKKKQVKRPVEDDEDEDISPKLPTGAFFPMFFGWGGRSGGGAPGGATAIANAYSTGKGGVASSHATAYGQPQPEYAKASLVKKHKNSQ